MVYLDWEAGNLKSVKYQKSVSRKREYILENKRRINVNNKERLRRQRAAVIEALGGKCVKCEFSDVRALQIDHINGGGSQERKEIGFNGTFHNHVLRSFLNNENKYQLLCANCNWIKRFENNECDLS